MMDKNKKKSLYQLNIEKAINAIQEKDYTTALGYIKSAVMENQDFPDAHNLLGIIAEFHRDKNRACKHYRASYALDPSYKPASRNLDRITSYLYNSSFVYPIYGDISEDEIAPYVVEYDEMCVGHLKKNKRIGE